MAFVRENRDTRLGSELTSGSRFTAMASIVLAEPGFTFASEEAFITESNWLTGIAGKLVIPLAEAFGVEDKSEELKQATSTSGFSKKTMNKIHKMEFTFDFTPEQRATMKGLEGSRFNAFIFDYFNNVKGVLETGGTIRGFKIKPLQVWFAPATVDMPELTHVLVQFEDGNEFDTKEVVGNPSWLLSDLKPIQKVKLTCGTVTSGDFTATVAYESTSLIGSDGNFENAKMQGIVTANLQVLSSAGVVRATTVGTATSDGVYPVTSSDVVATDTAQIVPTSSNLYESDLVTLA